MSVESNLLEIHPSGTLSKCGVLDVGRKCTHSCVFCFYSFYDGSNEQFKYLRTSSFLQADALKKILDQFKEWGFTNFDYTGGEPSIHPEIVEITRYAHKELGLRGRMISLSQFFQKKFRGASETLLEQLLDAGINDFLFSLHAVTPELFKELTGGQVENVLTTMRQLDERGFSYCTNTVVNEKNYKDLPALAREIARHQVRISNFIIMRMDWGLREQPGIALGTKGRYSDVMPSVKEAIDILESHGIAVNVRYTPYCVMKGYERHLVGHKGIELDPYEWRNGLLAASKGVPTLKAEDLQDYYDRRAFVYENDPVYNLVFGEKCKGCSLRRICDGVDKTYIETHGWDEFEPFSGERVEDICHFRHDYKGPFIMKTTQFDRAPL